MCGIAGIIADRPRPDLAGPVQRMVDALRHRGPDDEGVWTGAGGRVCLGHRRLSILELSDLGHQPMTSETGRYTIAFNGEVYNFRELRRRLEACGHRFRGGSDTEVVLAAFEEWGVEASLDRFAGMLAFGVWDEDGQRLVLARDRFGKKPLYYGEHGGTYAFASELKAFETLDWDLQIDRRAVDLLLRQGSIPSPHSIYNRIKKLPPGSWLAIRDGNVEGPSRYWSPRQAAVTAAARGFHGTQSEAVAELEKLLRQAVADRMVADVPVGAFLSGGIDSSLVVAMMQERSQRPVQTFTIGFEEADVDESGAARAIADHLGTHHHELTLSPEETLQVVELVSSLYDEPFADYSQIPTYLVSRMARQHVTVALSGDGGDEVFGGYRQYLYGQRLWSAMRCIPRPIRIIGAGVVRAVPARAWDSAVRLVPGSGRRSLDGDRILKGADLLGCRDAASLHRRLVAHHPPGRALVEGVSPSALSEPLTEGFGAVESIMLADTRRYLPETILTKVDRASMAVGLETRAPLLDHKVYEFAWRLPLPYKLRNGQGKWILRRVLSRYVPPRLIAATKKGFTLPMAEWLRGPLQDWAEDLLDPQRIAAEGFLRPGVVSRLWEEHSTGRRDWKVALWDILMFQSWLQRRREVGPA